MNNKHTPLRTPQHQGRRRKRQGMTLIEIMIVVIIMAMIATAVGIAVLPQFSKAKVKQAQSDAATIQSAVELYLASGGDGCPTVEELVASKELKKGTATADPWGNDFDIECSGDDITVMSAGPDGQMGSDDDVGTGASGE
ncbi:MAG: type II secretion system protein GspG [Myxococcales bacterium]|nr:type II secretion system protein GspG [Myxococcales bacterium]